MLETGNRQDYYLSHLPRQPKKEIADYVEQCGLLVPKRFASLDDALSSGLPFIVRSEHPQDYNGASGVLDSLYITSSEIQRCADKHGYIDRIDNELLSKVAYPMLKIKAAEQIVARLGRITQEELESYLVQLSSRQISMYCRFFPYSTEGFSKGITYSYWQGLEGMNRAIVADSAIKGRYHIFSLLPGPVNAGFRYELGCGYKILEDGKVIAGGSSEMPPESDDQLWSLTAFYEAVRGLDRFNNNHCPIIEAQSVDGKNYFLQYHRTVNFQASQFSLDREPEKEEVIPFWVRGATTPECLYLTVGVYYDDPSSFNGGEEAAFNHGGSPFRAEAAIRERKLQLIEIGDHPSYLYCTSGGHQPKSKLFKSQLGVVLFARDYKTLARGIDYSFKNPVPHMRIRYISDGRKGYLKRLD